jgi:ketosteroid isomerase-like protein
MKQISSVLLIMAILIACNEKTPVAAAPESLTKEEVTTFIAHYDSSWNAKKVGVIDSSMGKEYVYFSSLGSTTSRAKSLEVLAADYYKVLQAKRSELDILIDGNTAIVSSRWQGNGIWKDTTFKDNQRCGLVIQKQQGQLKLLAEHCVEIKVDTVYSNQ